jgi:hypothetical protein
MIFSTLPEYNGPHKVSSIDIELKTPKASILKLYYPTSKNTREFANFFPYPADKYFKGNHSLISNQYAYIHDNI